MGEHASPQTSGAQPRRQHAHSGQKLGAYGSRPARPYIARPASGSITGRLSVAGARSQRSLVRRLQGGVQAGQWPLLLPVTVADQASRYLLACEAFASTREHTVLDALRRAARGRHISIEGYSRLLGSVMFIICSCRVYASPVSGGGMARIVQRTRQLMSASRGSARTDRHLLGIKAWRLPIWIN